MVFKHRAEHATEWAAICSIADKIGCSGETLRSWVRQAERDSGMRAGPAADDRERLKTLERENRELRQANEILRKASAYFAQAEAVARGKPARATVSGKAIPCPLDRVNRQFHAPRPNALWLSDFTYAATWQGFAYVAFVTGALARRAAGWRISRTAQAGFVLDALEQALLERRPIRRGGLIHHSDRGVQYVSNRYTGRLAEAGIGPSAGSVGGGCGNALAAPPPRTRYHYKCGLSERQGR
jgi:transposase InsO family protein